jgi:hypothetical protein
MVAMQLPELVPGDASEPEKKRHRGHLEIMIQVLPRFEIRVLEHIRGIDSTLEALIQAKSHHPAQPLATLIDQGLPASGIPLGGQPQSLFGFVRVIRHPGSQNRVLRRQSFRDWLAATIVREAGF